MRQARLAERAAVAERAGSRESDEEEWQAAPEPPEQPATAAERANDAMYARALQAAAFAAEDAAAYGSADPATSVMLEQRFGPGVPAAPLPLNPGSPAFRDAPPELRSLPAQPSTLDAGAPGSAARLTQAEALVWSAAAAIAAQQRRAHDGEQAEAEAEAMEAAGGGGGGVERGAENRDGAAAPRLSASGSPAAMRGGFTQSLEQSRVEAAAAVAARSFAAALQPLSAAPPAAGQYGTR